MIDVSCNLVGDIPQGKSEVSKTVKHHWTKTTFLIENHFFIFIKFDVGNIFCQNLQKSEGGMDFGNIYYFEIII